MISSVETAVDDPCSLARPEVVLGVLEDIAGASRRSQLRQLLVRGAVECTDASRACLQAGGRTCAGGRALRAPVRLAVPVELGERRIGELTVESRWPLGGADVRAIHLLAGQAALAWDRLERDEALEVDADFAREVRTLQARLRRAPGLAPVQLLVEAACELLPASGAALVLAEPGPDRLELVAAHGASRDVLAALRLSAAGSSGPIRRAVGRGRVVAGRLGIAGGRPLYGLCAPLLTGGAVCGVLVVLARRPQRAAGPVRLRLEALGAGVADIVDRANRVRLYNRSLRLATLTDALSSAATPQDVLEAIVRATRETLRAVGGMVYLVSEDGSSIRIAASAGYDEERLGTYREVPLDADLPLTLCIRELRPVIVESRELVEAYFPAIRSSGRLSAEANGALLALPLVAGGAPLGAVGLSFASERLFDLEDLDFLHAVQRLAAQALDRAFRAQVHNQTKALAETAAAVARAVEPASVARIVLEAACAAVGADSAALAVVEQHTLKVVAAVGTRPPVVAGTIPRRSAHPLAAAVRAGAAVGSAGWEGEAGRAVVALPLVSAGETVAAMAVTVGGEGALEARVAGRLEALAGLAAESLARALLYERLARITDNALEARERLRGLLGRLRIGVVAADTETLRVEYANTEARELLGIEGEVVGRRLPDPWQALSLPALARAYATGATGSTLVELESGAVVEVDGLADDEGVLVVMRDVTAREQEAQAAREFVSNASHELRAPLAAIAAAAEALRHGGAPTSPRHADLVDKLALETERVATLANALLVLARAQSDPDVLRHERVELCALLRAVADRLQPAPSVELVTTCPEGMAVVADQALLESAILNLASNALRHTKRGRVAIDCTSGDDELVRISVVDTGDGIPARARQRVFDRFYRASDSPGFGLGLSLVREVARAFGGDVELTSALRRGTRVTLTLRKAA